MARNRDWRVLVRGLIGLLGATAVCGSSAAQNYKQNDKAIVDPRQVSQLRREVTPILRSTAALSPTEQQTLQQFYYNVVVAGMTRPEALQGPQQFPNWRKAVLNDLSQASAAPAKHDFIRDLLFKSSSSLYQDRTYSPFARYNALLLIGGLNEREAQVSGGAVTPAVPYGPARNLLLNVLGSDDSQDMKVGALIGLARHARLLAAAGTKPEPKLVAAFVEVLKQKQPPAGGTQDGLHWMQRTAIEGLGDIGLPAATQILEPIMADAALPLSLRCAAADALGRLDFANAANINQAVLVKVLKGLGQLAAASLTEQIKSLQQHIKENPPEIVREGARGPDQEIPEDPYVLRVRRQLKYQLTCVGQAIRALEQASNDVAFKNALTAIKSEIGAVVKELDAKNLKPKDLFDKIGPPAMKLENAVKAV